VALSRSHSSWLTGYAMNAARVCCAWCNALPGLQVRVEGFPARFVTSSTYRLWAEELQLFHSKVFLQAYEMTR
jgi:hypothetical protein